MLINIIIGLSVFFGLTFLWKIYKIYQRNNIHYLIKTSDTEFNKLEMVIAKFIEKNKSDLDLNGDQFHRIEGLNNWYQTILNEVSEQKNKFISLQEKFIHNKGILIGIIQDFINYCQLQKNIVTYPNTDTANESKLKLDQINKRFESLLKK